MLRPTTITEIASRANARLLEFDSAVREFLDSWQGMTRRQKAAAIAQEPMPVGSLHDAYLASLAEHLSLLERIDTPAWTEDPSRFLERPFFSGGLESLKATLLVESPLAFRRRLIFISANALSRPRRTISDEETVPS